MLEQTDNQYIVRILQLMESDDKLFIVMELTRYGQLENFFYVDHPDELSEQINTLILKQLFGALKYLHNTKNIMHRDIKPENILVSDFDFSKQRVYIMLTDFGFACQE